MESEAERRYGYSGKRVQPTEPKLREIKSAPVDDVNKTPDRGFDDVIGSTFGGKPTVDVEYVDGTIVMPANEGINPAHGYVRISGEWYRIGELSVLQDETIGMLLDEEVFITYG